MLDACFAFFLITIQAFFPTTIHAGASGPGFALGLYGATRVLLQGPSGFLARRIGPGRQVLLGMGGGATALLVLAGADSPERAYTLVLLYGAATALAWPAIYLRAGDLVQERGTLFGLITLCSLGGASIGLALGILVVDQLPARGLILGDAAALLLGTAGVVTLSRLVRPVPVADSMPYPRRQEPGRDVVARLCATLAMQGLAFSMAMPILRQYVHEQLDMEMHRLILFIAPAGLIAAVAVFPFGRLADRAGRGPAIALGAILAASGSVVASVTNSRFEFALGAIPLAVGYAGSMCALSAWIADLTDETGGNVGLALTVQGASLAVGPIVSGLLIAHGGPPVPWLFAAGAWLLTALCATIPLAERAPAWRVES